MPPVYRSGDFKYAVGQGRLSVVYMGDNRKIPDQ
jgi:hypothetical protein